MLGNECKLFRGTAGATAATLMTNVMDLDVSDSRSSHQVTKRGDGGFHSFRSGLRTVEVSFKMEKDGGADYSAIEAAYTNNTPLAFLAADPDGAGLDADWNVVEFSDTEPIDGIVETSVKLTINTDERTPAAHTPTPPSPPSP